MRLRLEQQFTLIQSFFIPASFNMNSRKLIFLLKAVTVIIFLLFIALQIVVSNYDINNYKERVIQRVKLQTGHNLRINGDFKIKLSPFPSLIIGDIELENVAWGKNPHMFSAKRVEVKIALLPLIGRSITINKLTVVRPNIHLEKSDNRINVLLKKQSNMPTQQISTSTPVEDIQKDKNILKETKTLSNEKIKSDVKRKFKIKEIEVKDGELVISDINSGKSISFSRGYATIQNNDLNSPLKFIASGNYSKRRLHFNGEIDNITSLLQNKKTYFDSNIIISHINTNISGHIENPLSANGSNFSITSELDSLRSLNRILGKTFPHVGPNYLHMVVTDKNGEYLIKDFNVVIGETKANGDVKVSLNGFKPSVVAKLSTHHFDATPYIKTKNNIDEFTTFNSDLLNHFENINIDITVDKLKALNEISKDTNYQLQLSNSTFSVKKKLN